MLRALRRMRAWIFAIARNCLLNEGKARMRRRALRVRIASESAKRSEGHEDAVAGRTDLARAWHQLTASDQEVIALAVWDELSSEQAANVLGISAAAYRTRLSRARTALRKLVDSPGAAFRPSPAYVRTDS